MDAVRKVQEEGGRFVAVFYVFFFYFCLVVFSFWLRVRLHVVYTFAFAEARCCRVAFFSERVCICSFGAVVYIVGEGCIDT